MGTFKDPIEMYSQLSEVVMRPERDAEIRRSIERLLKDESSKPITQRRRGGLRSWGSVLAACVGLALVAVGLYAQRHVVSHVTPNNTMAQEGRLQADKAAEVVTPNWRLVIVNSLLKHGPFYDVQLYYEGKQPISNFKVKWHGSEVSPGSEPVQPGSQLVGFEMVSLRKGLADTPPVQVTWIGKNGQKHTESLALSDAKYDLKVVNYHEYLGSGRQWSVSYAYETIMGKSFQEPYGLLLLNYRGKSIGNNIAYTLTSAAGAEHMSYENPQFGNSIRMNVDPTQKGYDITQPEAKITIHWQRNTEALTLRAKK